jgi:prohibitin 2
MGISSVFSLLSVLGFIIFVVGVAGAVMALSQNRKARNGWLLAAVGIVIGAVFSFVSQGVIVLQPAEVAVVFNTVGGGLAQEPLTSGTRLVVPVIQQATIYSTAQQQYTMSGSTSEGARSGDDAVRARTSDGQEVLMDITVIYGVDPVNVNTLHTRWQNRFENDFIRPTTRGLVRDVVAGFRAQDIYGEGRADMELQIQTQLGERFTNEGLLLSDVLVRDINFSDLFTAAIEQAQIAEQESERARLRVQQIQQEAEQARAQAEGQRDAAIARAEGDAQSIILRAQAQAEALRLVSEQIAANPALIQYEYIQNLSDNVNLVLVPANSPFLFDLESITNAAQSGTELNAPAVPAPLEIVPAPEATPTPAPGS